MLISHCTSTAASPCSELRETSAEALGWALQAGLRGVVGEAAGSSSGEGKEGATVAASVSVISSSLATLLGDSALHVKTAAAAAIARGVLFAPSTSLSSLENVKTLAGVVLDPLVYAVTKDTPNPLLRHKANVALGAILVGGVGGASSATTAFQRGPRTDILAVAPRETARFLEGYWTKILRKELEDTVEEGKEEEE